MPRPARRALCRLFGALALLALLALPSLAPRAARAGTFTGMGGATCYNDDGTVKYPAEDGTDWDVKRNWGPDPCHPGSVPSDAVIPAGFGVQAHHSLSLGSLSLTGGLVVEGPTSIGSLTLTGGSLGTPTGLDHRLAVTVQNLDWMEGSLFNLDVLIPPGGTAGIRSGPDPNHNYIHHIGFSSLRNQGTMFWQGPGQIFGDLVNEGTFNLTGDGPVADGGAGGMTLTNSGTIVKTIGDKAGVDIASWTNFTNTGTITANPGAGTILVGGYIKSGSVLNGGNVASPLSSPADGVELTNTLRLYGTITAHGRLIFAFPASLSSGASGVATLQGDALVDWLYGGFGGDPTDGTPPALTLGPGIHTVFSGPDSAPISVGNLTNNGLLEWQGPTPVTGTLTNNATFALTNPVDGATLARQDLGLSVANNGLMAKTTPGTTHLGGVTLANKGAIDAGPGILSLDSVNDTLLDGSVLDGHIGGFAGGTFQGDVHIHGVFDVEGSQNLGGGPVVATLHGPGSVSWHGGELASAIVPSQITFAPDLTVNVSGDLGKTISGGLTNRGTINWLGGAPIATGSQPNGFANAPGGTLNAKAAGAFLSLGGPFVNDGTVNTVPGGTSQIQGGGVFQNNGILNVGGPGTIGILEFLPDPLLTQSASGRTNLDITGSDPSQFDRILTYHVQLGGALDLHPAGPGALGVATPLQVLTYKLTSGGRNDTNGNPTAFAAVNGGTPAYEDEDLLVTFVPAAPPNDNIADAQVITGSSGSATGDDVKATYENPFLFPGWTEPEIGGRGGGKSVWYKWTAPRDGIVQIDTHGSNFDTLLSVFTFDAVTACPQCPPFDLHQVGSNDDVNGSDPTSEVNISVQKDHTYTIGVDSFNGGGGFIALNWDMGLDVQPGPVNQTITSLATVFGEYSVLVFSPENNTPLTLTVNGTGFTPESRVLLNKHLLKDVTTAYISPTQLVASIPASYLKTPHVSPPIWVEVLTGNQVTDGYGLPVEEYVAPSAPGGGSASASTPKKRGFKLQSVESVTVQNPDPQPTTFWALADQSLLDYARTGDVTYLGLHAFYLGMAVTMNVLGGGPPSPNVQVTLSTSIPSSTLPPFIKESAALGLGLPRAAVLVSHDGGSIISKDGAGIISKDGAGIISKDGAGLISQDGGNLLPDGSFAGGGQLLPLGTLQPLGATPLQDPPVGAGWHVVRGSGGHLPTVTNANDPETGEPVGTITVTLDNTSIPKVTELDKQMFFVVLPKYGDVNGDGSTDVSDAILELQAIVGLTTLDELQVLNADLAPVPGAGPNAGAAFGDGNLDVSDVIRLLRRIVGLEPDPFP